MVFIPFTPASGASPGSTYVAPSGDPTGATDLANINGAIAAGKNPALFGAYTINGPIAAGVSGLKITGTDPVSTSITQKATTANGISITAGGALSDIYLEGFTLNGPGSGSGIGIFGAAAGGAAGITRLGIKRVAVNNFGSDGTQILNSVLSLFEQVEWFQCGGIGFHQAQNTTSALMGCWAHHCGLQGYLFANVTDATLLSCGSDVNAIGYELNACHSCNIISSDANSIAAAGGLDGSSFKISNGSQACVIQSPYVSANAAIGYYVTGNSIKNTLISPIELATVGATASIQVDLGSAAAIINPDVNTAQSLPGSTVTLQPGFLFVSTLETSTVFIDNQTIFTNGGAHAISQGSGAPSLPSGANPTAGDMWFRTDTPGTANQRLYVCTVGGATPTWVGIA